MSSTACAAIETHLELYAAGECDEPTRLLVEKHLASCLTCLHVYHQAGRLIHGLDWQLRREGRLREAETRFAVRERSARRRRTWLWAGAVASSIFLLLGLSWKALYGPPELAKTNQGTGNGQGRYAKHELPGGTTLWAAPNTRWQLLGERKVALT